MLGILVLAGVWRAAVAATIPCVTRDSVVFCEYARELGAHGASYLREPRTHQHPLFPVTVLGAQRVARVFGASDSPLTWQRSGQAVSWLAGMAVVGLVGAVTVRFVWRLGLPVDARLAGCGAMLLAALLPLNVWLSAEVMSDQMHAAFYLVGALALLKLDGWRPALLCGLAGGLAFLTRPEGLVILAAGLVTVACTRGVAWRRRAVQALVLIAAFAACATPYWVMTGKLSAKKSPLDWLRDREAAAVVDPEWQACVGVRPPRQAVGHPGGYVWHRHLAGVGNAHRYTTAGAGPGRCGGGEVVSYGAGGLLGKLELLNLSWYALVPWALYTLFRAGRIVVPLLALFPLINLRGQFLRPPLVGLVACMVGHFALTVVLLHKHHYLNPRHMLVVIMLLTPFAATLLGRLVELGRSGRWPVTPVVVVVTGLLLPLALYSLRQPNAGDRYLVDAARWLAERDPEIASKVVMSGSSPRRVAFYAGARWADWYESPEYLGALQRRIMDVRPDYFLLETGKGYERKGMAAVLAHFDDDAELSRRATLIETRPVPGDAALYVFELDWTRD